MLSFDNGKFHYEISRKYAKGKFKQKVFNQSYETFTKNFHLIFKILYCEFYQQDKESSTGKFAKFRELCQWWEVVLGCTVM